jgi:hypothetical protein
LGDVQCKLELVKCLISSEMTTEGKVDAKIADYLRQITVSDPANA